MAENNKLVVMIAMMLIAAIAYIIEKFLSKALVDFRDQQQPGTIKDFMNFITTQGLFEGLLWLLVCIICYIGVKKVIEGFEPIGPISLFFLLIWLGTVIGLVIGSVIYTIIQNGNVVLNIDTFVNTIATTLTLALGPSFAAALGISTKGQ